VQLLPEGAAFDLDDSARLPAANLERCERNNCRFSVFENCFPQIYQRAAPYLYWPAPHDSGFAPEAYWRLCKWRSRLCCRWYRGFVVRSFIRLQLFRLAAAL
jgi:hypothetical protein